MIKQLLMGYIPEEVKMSTPPKPELGDISLEFFQLARLRKTSPMSLAEEFKAKLEDLEFVVSAEIAGPYLNLKLDRNYCFAKIKEGFDSKDLFNVNVGNNKPALIEHTSVNPNASPHIGRARNAILGDTISRILRKVGFDLKVHYYVNDMGKQIALLALACKDKENVSFDDILDIYVEYSEKMKNDLDFEQEVFQYLKEFEEGNEQVRSEFESLVNKCVKGQSEILSNINISYDSFDRESDLLNNEELDKHIEKMIADEIIFTDDQGRQVMDLKKIGFPREEGRYYVIRRSNGSTLYGYRDISYHIMKSKLAPEEGTNFIVLGEDHKLYAEQMKLILNYLGYNYPEVIHYSFISLTDGKMSTRKGTVVLLSDFYNQVKEKVKEKFGDRKFTDEIISKIATGAVRFNIIKSNPNTPLTFDIETAVALEGDTCPYVQYTAVRSNKIVNDAGDLDVSNEFEISDPMWELIKSVSSYKEVLEDSYTKMNPARMAQYLLELGQKYNSFYGNTLILKNQDISQKYIGVECSRLASETIKEGLDVLGIEVPEYM